MENFFELIPSLSPQSQELVKTMIRQLCENEGINLPREPALGLQTLEEGLPLWESWLVGQSYSKGSVRLYTYYVSRFLAMTQHRHPFPFRNTYQTSSCAGLALQQ